MVLDNDTRGWVMTCISGVACVCGASVICVDVVVRMIPRYRHFEIAHSDTFLSASLSLSFGVMLFSSLYSMLPSARDYLVSSGLGRQAASYLLIGLFLAGVLGIQILSRVLHRFIPTHIVDCDHTHVDEEEAGPDQEEMEEQRHDQNANNSHHPPLPTLKVSSDSDDEETPLLLQETSFSPPKRRHLGPSEGMDAEAQLSANGSVTDPASRRPSMLPRGLTRTFTKLATPNIFCDETGPCKGFSDPCGQHCFQAAARRGSGLPISAPPRQTTFQRTPTTPASLRKISPEPTSAEEETNHSAQPHETSDTADPPPFEWSHAATHHYHHPVHGHNDAVTADGRHRTSTSSWQSDGGKVEHHHHVPTNAFLSIGLQTSIAIALHKAPEGFITYATNHANPTLGFAVFMALFIHNITEGFAMALPLYLALQSRTKAIIWSSLLGGVSQPLGAAFAALWFKLAKGTDGVGKPNEDVYGCMFAITSGIMASVALQLFSESLSLTHHKTSASALPF